MTQLDVWLEAFEQPVGTLTANEDGGASFTYSPDYLVLPRAHPISLSLGLTDEPFNDRQTRAFFQNLLPENDQLDQIIARENLERTDIVGILFYLGADLSGAISCLPAGSAPVKSPGRIDRDYEAITEEQLRDLARRLGENQPLPNEVRDPSPVAGYQRKIALTLLPDGRYGIPVAGSGAPTTHILKVPETGFPREAFYEGVCARLATHIGLDAAPSRSFWIGQYEVLLSERYDRIVDDGSIYRLHQEDFAQALGLPPRLKYEREGTENRRFDVSAILRVLQQTTSPALAIDAFLRATIFNLAIGNTDNHAKNHALLYDAGPVPRLAPLYDLVPIVLSEQHNHRLSFMIGTAAYPDDVTVDDLRTLLTQFGLAGPAQRRFVARRIIPILEPLAQDPAPNQDAWSKRLDDEVTRRSTRLLDYAQKLAAGEPTV